MLCLRAVRELEKAGKHPSVLLGIWENCLLEVDSVRQEDVVLIHSETQIAWQPAVRLDNTFSPAENTHHSSARLNKCHQSHTDFQLACGFQLSWPLVAKMAIATMKNWTREQQ